MATARSRSYSKQRRSSNDAADCLLSDIPNGLLAHTATFLSAPSRALFAVALDVESSAAFSPNERSSAIIVGSEWSALDFGEVEKELAEKLSDDDVSAVLLCIDAVNRVKRLKLTVCVNITGAGLGPLRGSLIIEQIDLSLVGDGESPYLDPEPPISRDHVVPILESIIERGECALKVLQFPKAWREERSTESAFHQFLQRYNEMLESRGMYCVECNETIHEDTMFSAGESYALQSNICYECMEHFCSNCTSSVYLWYCATCDRGYCDRCIPILVCDNEGCDIQCTYCKSYVDCCTRGCDKKGCAGCARPCFNCNRNWCEDCRDRNIHECVCCDKICCAECLEEEGANAAYQCDNERCYFGGFCKDCRLRECQQGHISCSSCFAMAFSTISKRAQELKNEVDQLKDENEDLKDEVKRLRTKMNDLE